MRVAINGFGRIGRTIFRANLLNPKIDIVAINDLGLPEMGAYLLKYDSNYGPLHMDIKGEPGKLTVNGKETTIVSNRNPEELPWKDMDIDLVIECTGVFTDKAGASKHLQAGAKRVMISAPAKDAVDGTFVMGVNHELFDPAKDFVFSNASCTTNCLAPVAKILNDSFGIERGLMSTAHSYTNDQNLMDNDHKDFRRSRAAALNMLLTSTGAAKAIGLVIPDLDKKLNGVAIRVPTPVVSLVDLTVDLKKPATVEEINAAFKAAEAGPMKGILGTTDLPLASMDFKGDARSAIVDVNETQVMEGKMAKIFAWYDNEWGYSMRCLELAAYIASKV